VLKIELATSKFKYGYHYASSHCPMRNTMIHASKYKHNYMLHWA